MTRGAVQTLTETATFVVFHPVRSALRVLGVAKGVVETVAGHREPSVAAPEPEPAQESTSPPVSVVPPQRVPDLEPLPAAEQIAPADPGESFATEPSAVEGWEDELDDDVEVPTPADVPDDEPLLDPSLTKQVKADLDRGLRDAEQ